MQQNKGKDPLQDSKPIPAGAGERVLYLLTLFAQQARPLAVAELTELSGLAISTLYRQLALLKSWGFVQESAGNYMLGPACLQLALGFDQTSWLVREALPEMHRLSEKTNETIGLMVVAHEQMVCLDVIRCAAPLLRARHCRYFLAHRLNHYWLFYLARIVKLFCAKP